MLGGYLNLYQSYNANVLCNPTPEVTSSIHRFEGFLRYAVFCVGPSQRRLSEFCFFLSL